MIAFFPGCFVYSGQMAWRRKSWQILDICLFVCSLSPVRKDDLDQETLSKRYFLANGPWLALLHCSSWFIGHCKWGIRIDSIATLWKYDSCCSRINQQHQSSIVNEGSVAFACFQNFQQHRFVRLETKACLQIMQTDKNYDLQIQRCYPLY